MLLVIRVAVALCLFGLHVFGCGGITALMGPSMLFVNFDDVGDAAIDVAY